MVAGDNWGGLNLWRCDDHRPCNQGRRLSLKYAYSTIRSLHGVGSTLLNSGRVMDVNDAMACPGAKDGSCFHKPSLMPPIDFRSLPTTAESPILWIIQLLISANTSSGRC